MHVMGLLHCLHSMHVWFWKTNVTMEKCDNMVLKQTFIVNSDLKMGKGKIAGQVGHALVFYMEKSHKDKNSEMYSRFLRWRYEDEELMKKVVIKASYQEIIRLRLLLQNNNEYTNIWTDLVYDRGLTQVPENSLSCMVVEPLEEEIYDKLFGHLKLL